MMKEKNRFQRQISKKSTEVKRLTSEVSGCIILVPQWPIVAEIKTKILAQMLYVLIFCSKSS